MSCTSLFNLVLDSFQIFSPRRNLFLVGSSFHHSPSDRYHTDIFSFIWLVHYNTTFFNFKGLFFYSGSSSPFRAQTSYSVPWSFFTDGRTPWTSAQSVARQLPKHTATQTQNKRIHTPNIFSQSGIRTHDPSFQVSEDSSCLRPRGHCDLLKELLALINKGES
jgi:hypothetical protein